MTHQRLECVGLISPFPPALWLQDHVVAPKQPVGEPAWLGSIRGRCRNVQQRACLPPCLPHPESRGAEGQASNWGPQVHHPCPGATGFLNAGACVHSHLLQPTQSPSRPYPSSGSAFSLNPFARNQTLWRLNLPCLPHLCPVKPNNNFQDRLTEMERLVSGCLPQDGLSSRDPGTTQALRAVRERHPLGPRPVEKRSQAWAPAEGHGVSTWGHLWGHSGASLLPPSFTQQVSVALLCAGPCSHYCGYNNF